MKGGLLRARAPLWFAVVRWIGTLAVLYVVGTSAVWMPLTAEIQSTLAHLNRNMVEQAPAPSSAPQYKDQIHGHDSSKR